MSSTDTQPQETGLPRLRQPGFLWFDDLSV